MTSLMTVDFSAKRYVWDDGYWYGENDYMAPPQAIVDRLNAIVAAQVAAEDAAISNRAELLQRAKQARCAGQLLRAANLARRVYDGNRDNVGVAAFMSSLWREMRRPEEALKISDEHRASSFAPLMTSRAAALCDLGRWSEALRLIRNVLAANRRDHDSGSPEALAVHARIKANAAELFGRRRPRD